MLNKFFIILSCICVGIFFKYFLTNTKGKVLLYLLIKAVISVKSEPPETVSDY